MSLKLGSLVLVLCSSLLLMSGCAETHDDDGVDGARAGDAGYARVTFTVVGPNGEARPAGTAHHLYFDENASIPGEDGSSSYAAVPEDGGQLGYSIATREGGAFVFIYDLAARDADGVPVNLASFMCFQASMSRAEGMMTFESPNRSSDGTFVRVELVDVRSAFCRRRT